MQVQTEQIVGRALERLNELLPRGQALSNIKETVLVGQNGELDSMGFVNLLAAVEEELEEQLGIQANVADAVMNRGDAEFTVGDLQDAVVKACEGKVPGVL